MVKLQGALSLRLSNYNVAKSRLPYPPPRTQPATWPDEEAVGLPPNKAQRQRAPAPSVAMTSGYTE